MVGLKILVASGLYKFKEVGTTSIPARGLQAKNPLEGP